MTLLRGTLLLLAKELRIELRTREILTSTGLFGTLLVVLASLSFYLDDVISPKVAPGVLWLTIAFAGLLAIGRSWARERDQEALLGVLLSDVPWAAVFLAKALSVLLFLLAVEACLLPLVALFFQLDLTRHAPALAATMALGTVGFVFAGTLFGAMSVQGRSRDLMVSIVVFPLTTPALLASVVATRELFMGAPIEEIVDWFRILGAFDLVFIVLGAVLFEPLMRD